ncbi:fibronectin type III domain-containing protein [Lewinella sp. W8]|uniref:fibronectin type III domain-containing protein n=1 Tax=Lewinella sp. W8 TaxID=2528208 RepID=UPI001068660B|nr:hypothetical protein [Lewinella sp. W8]MTB52345.1 hypothetical protein [Lewinella sp. W8]
MGLIFWGASAGAGYAQEADYQFFHKVEPNGSVKLRFMPLSRTAFRFANRTPQQLEIFRGADPQRGITPQRLRTITLAPLPPEEWLENLTGGYWDSSALAGIHYERLPDSYLDSTFLAEEYEDSDNQREALRLGFTNFAQNQDFSITEKAGYGHQWEREDGVTRYGLKFYPTPTGDTLYYEIDLANYVPPPVPVLNAKFKERRVSLDWNFKEFTDLYYGYQLFRSDDAGQTFYPVFNTPLINGMDSTLNTTLNNSEVLVRTESFTENGDSVIYRLHGADYLGGYSRQYSQRSGVVGSDIELSPVLDKTIQTDSNYAVIQWSFDERFAPYVEEFRILHRPDSESESTVALAGIPPDAREVAVPMRYRSNFYRVQAISFQGTALASFESLVLMYDVDPPAVPQNLSGKIDSNGIVTLSWSGSNEEDLAGYYLFKGFFRNTELAMITPNPLTETAYVDTVSMKTGNDTVFYQVRSVDFRGNGSNFTPRLALVKPDVFPPAPPQFKSIEEDGTLAILHWTRSPSPDVVTYRLYRTELPDAKEWELLEEWDEGEFPSRYEDASLLPGRSYRYVLRAEDDAGLLSTDSQPVSLRLRDSGLRPPIENFSVREAEAPNSGALLRWEYGESPRAFYLYRAQGDRPTSLLKVIGGDQRSFLDPTGRPNKQYRYLIRALFPNGKVSPFTEEVVFE